MCQPRTTLGTADFEDAARRKAGGRHHEIFNQLRFVSYRRARASLSARPATRWTLRSVSRSRSWPFPANAGLSRPSPRSVADARACPRDGPAGAPAAPRPGRTAPGTWRSRPPLEPAGAAIEAGHAFLHKTKGGAGIISRLAAPGDLDAVVRQCGQPQALDDAADNRTPFGVRGAAILDTFLLDARLPCPSSNCSQSWRSAPSGQAASRSRCRSCGQPSVLGGSSRNFAALGLSLQPVTFCGRRSGP